MSSELGCITPWIMAFEPNKSYTPAELQHHAEIVVAGVHNNASCNCLAPKVIVVAEEWPQREEFQKLVRKEWQKLDLPVAYYPGCKERWNKYKKAYADASEWNGAKNKEGRGLSPPLLSNGKRGEEAVVLPLLVINLEVDLSTEAGRASAREEYAFQHEPFCPVLTFATLKTTASSTTTFMELATDLCNKYIYGTLSCTISVPKSLEKNPGVEAAIAKLQYGSIGINLWTLLAYAFSWGGFQPAEKLNSIQSGIGRVGNYKFVPYLQKAVVRAPPILSSHFKAPSNYVQVKRELTALGAVIEAPGIVSFANLILVAVLKLDPEIGWGAIGAMFAAVAVAVALAVSK